jgi:hypothetical protein
MGPSSTTVVHCNTQNFETIMKSSEAQKELQQHDNTRPYTSQTTMVASEKLDLTILPHQPHSADLVSCNFHCFSINE